MDNAIFLDIINAKLQKDGVKLDHPDSVSHFFGGQKDKVSAGDTAAIIKIVMEIVCALAPVLCSAYANKACEPDPEFKASLDHTYGGIGGGIVEGAINSYLKRPQAQAGLKVASTTIGTILTILAKVGIAGLEAWLAEQNIKASAGYSPEQITAAATQIIEQVPQLTQAKGKLDTMVK